MRILESDPFIPMLDFERKICEPAQFSERARALARPLVFTNGVFDILHRGHVSYLAEARSLGQSLVVALNSDASARRLGKGADRPINALESVALVTWFDEDTPIERIVACRPEHLVKGGDWSPDRIVGAKEVASWGGKVHSIPFRHDRSTTQILSRIRT